MNQIRYILSFLLVAGVAGVHAQQPIVKINSGSLATECDVTAPPGAPIFQLDATGNVLVTGTMSGSGCAGGTGTPSFGFNPPASGVVINNGSTQVVAGSVATVPLTYQAYNASSCSVGTPTTTGTCPAISASNGSCQGSGAQNSCAPTGATLSIPTQASMGTNTSCGYTTTATCSPGGVTSSAILTVTTTQQGSDPGCPTPPQAISTGSGGTWTRVTSTSVKFGDGTTVAGVNATDYVAVWTYPGTTVPWPGSYGLSTRPSASANMYFSEKFVVPTDGSVTGHPSWTTTGSGQNGNASFTISTCPGDFGQTGTVLTTGCKVNMGSGTLFSTVSATQIGSYCSLKPGSSYYLNILPMANLPVSNTSTSTCSGTCLPWLVVTNN